MRPFHAGMINSRQIRAARGLLGISQQALADAANVSMTVVSRLERDDTDARLSTLKAVKDALEASGIEFVDRRDGVIGVLMQTAGLEKAAPPKTLKLAGARKTAK